MLNVPQTVPLRGPIGPPGDGGNRRVPFRRPPNPPPRPPVPPPAPPVPPPSPPPVPPGPPIPRLPLRGGGLLGGGLLLGGLLWGFWNWRQDTSPDPDDPNESWGQRDAVGQSRVRLTSLRWTDKGSAQPCIFSDPKQAPNLPSPWSDWGQYSNARGRSSGGAGRCGGTVRYDVILNRTGGGESTLGSIVTGDGAHGPGFSAQWEFRNGALRSPNAPQPKPRDRPPPVFPEPIGPTPEPQAPPLRPPLAPPLPAPPGVEPAPPQTDPANPPERLPPARPPTAPPTTPSRPPSQPSRPGRQPGRPVPQQPGQPQPQPPRDPGPQRPPGDPDVDFGNDGQPLPQPPQQPDQTAPGIIVIGDLIIGQPGAAPQPDMEGIARELGRIEQKTEALLRRPQPEAPELPDITLECDLGSIQQQLEDILSQLEQIRNRPDPEFPEFPEIPPCPEFPEIPEPPDLGPLTELVEQVLAELRALAARPDPEFPEIPPCPEFPEIPDPPDLGPIEAQLELVLEELERIKNRPDPDFPDPPDPVDLGPIEEKLAEILAELKAEFDGDSYELQPPCGRDAQGNPLDADVATWQGGEGRFNQLARQIDALALLIQYSKDQRQPICVGKPRGEEVTVNFREAP